MSTTKKKVAAPPKPKWPDLYSSKNDKQVPGWRKLEDLELVKYDDVVWNNASRLDSPGRFTSSFRALVLDGYDFACYAIRGEFSHGVFTGPVTAEQCLNELFRIADEGLVYAMRVNGMQLAKKKYSIWRKKIHLTRRDWQDQPLPLP